MEKIQDIEMGTGSYNKYRKMEWVKEMDWVQKYRVGLGSWNGYRKLEQVKDVGMN